VLLVRHSRRIIREPYIRTLPFGIVPFESCFCGVLVGEDLQMIGIADLFARTDIDEQVISPSLAWAGASAALGSRTRFSP
jgi:hypothetical protein